MTDVVSVSYLHGVWRDVHDNTWTLAQKAPPDGEQGEQGEQGKQGSRRRLMHRRLPLLPLHPPCFLCSPCCRTRLALIPGTAHAATSSTPQRAAPASPLRFRSQLRE